MVRQNIGNSKTGYELGSLFGSPLINITTTGSSNVLNASFLDRVVFQWTVTGSCAGSVLGGNNNTSWAVLDTQDFSGATDIIVGFENSSLPRYLKVDVGSNSNGSFSGSVTCTVLGRS